MSISGFIKKKGSKQGLWHKRYVYTQNDNLIVAKDNLCSSILQIIPLNKNTIISPIQDASTPRFSVQNSDEEPNIFSTVSEIDNQQWVATLTSIARSPKKLSMDDFNVISVLGRGFYGKVLLCQKKDTGAIFAIKTIRKSRLIETGKEATVVAERNILMKVHFPFIVNLCFAFQTDSKFYLGLEYAPGGELFFLMERIEIIPLNDARLYIAEIGLTLSYLHSCNIIYRDLKPENVLFGADGHVKLTDFGLSKDLEGENKTTTFCGTSEYLAPEMILKKQYSYPIDIWALGILSYEMLLGDTPFYDENKTKMFEKIVNDPPLFPPDLDPRVSDFISKLLTKDPAKRPTFDEMKNHPFFEGFDWDHVLHKAYYPSYFPEIQDPLSTANFDPEFTKEIPADSYVPTPSDVINIPGFSYVESPIK